MEIFQKKNRFRRFLESVPFLVLFGVVLLFFAYNIMVLANKAIDTANNKKTAEEKVSELKKMQADLEENIEKLKTEKGVDESIRDKFGLAKEGEEMVVIVEDKANATQTEGLDKKGFFYFFENLLK